MNFIGIPIQLAVEDSLSESVLRAIIRHSGRDYQIGVCYCRGGFGYLKTKIAGFNNAAKRTPFVVLADLDDSECAPLMIRKWLPNGANRNLIFRMAVREIESWVLADRDGFARFLRIPKRLVPTNPDNLKNPKKHLIDLARKSQIRGLREALVPAIGSTAQVGPDYNGSLAPFIKDSWDVAAACQNSPSLKRAFDAIRAFKPT